MLKSRQGIALLELIFSIVIIAITLMAVPNLLQTTSKAANKVITQESISNAASYANMIMSAFWDENCTDPKYNNPILYVQNQDSSLQEYNTSGILQMRRVGSPKTTPRQFKSDLSTGSRLSAFTTLGQEAGETETDDVDDYNGKSVTLIERNSTSANIGEYKDYKIHLNSQVTYITDSVPGGYDQTSINFDNPFDANKTSTQSTNIKLITVTLTSDNEADKKIVLKAFSCNIGSSKLKERLF